MTMIKQGKSPDLNPFWHGEYKYRDTGVIFEYTEEELKELEKCAFDIDYFVEKYCTFKNDKGRTCVKLRDYQHKILKLFGEEVWDPKSETIVPKNRYITLMQSRQTGKCVTMDTDITVPDQTYKQITEENKNRYTFLNFIKKIFTKG